MLDVIVAPDPVTLGRPMLFLAGGISACPDWQSDMIRLLDPLPRQWVLLNPRRTQFPMQDHGAPFAQISWGHQALRAAQAIVFWFPKESLCPIALYELGAWSMTSRRIFIGADEAYAPAAGHRDPDQAGPP
jgi:hypothetical protein